MEETDLAVECAVGVDIENIVNDGNKVILNDLSQISQVLQPFCVPSH